VVWERTGIDPSHPVAHWQAYAVWLKHTDPSFVANTVICLIHQTNYLLDQQINALERDFVQSGGYTEQLAVARLAERKKQSQADLTDLHDRREKAPDCPCCGKPMVVRTARQGRWAGSQFWGCSAYPECTGILELEWSVGSDRS